jgi:hypothetical protein
LPQIRVNQIVRAIDDQRWFRDQNRGLGLAGGAALMEK